MLLCYFMNFRQETKLNYTTSTFYSGILTLFSTLILQFLISEFLCRTFHNVLLFNNI